MQAYQSSTHEARTATRSGLASTARLLSSWLLVQYVRTRPCPCWTPQTAGKLVSRRVGRVHVCARPREAQLRCVLVTTFARRTAPTDAFTTSLSATWPRNQISFVARALGVGLQRFTLRHAGGQSIGNKQPTDRRRAFEGAGTGRAALRIVLAAKGNATERCKETSHGGWQLV